MNKDQLNKLRQLWASPELWRNFCEYLDKEAQSALTCCKTKTDERALGRYFFIKQLQSMRDIAEEIFDGTKHSV